MIRRVFQISMLLIFYYCVSFNKDKQDKILIKSNYASSNNKLPGKNTFLKPKDMSNDISRTKVLVIFVHGLTVTEEICSALMGYTKMQKSLRKEFENRQIKIIDMRLGNSISMRVNSQGEMIHRKLLWMLHTDKLRKTKIIFIGHSVGGLASYSFYKKYGHIFNVKGILTLSCPWKGTNILEGTQKHKFFP